MQASAQRLGMEWPGGFQDLAGEALAAADEQDAVLRLYLDAGPRGLRPSGAMALVSSLPAISKSAAPAGSSSPRLLGVRAERAWLLGGSSRRATR